MTTDKLYRLVLVLVAIAIIIWILHVSKVVLFAVSWPLGFILLVVALFVVLR